ncbi:MAG: hypothetical protein JRG84_13890 [Deltaproteobacteria bacterium]|nr:hypothetical protein [Deltaproteobacteria bacterium]
MTEQSMRQHLGIPDDAERVIVFAESSHWDPNWLYTSEEYFQRFVRDNLDRAIEELQREPRRIYSVECIFFLRMYWERRPEQRESIRALVNERRLRLTSSGVTTADTLLPSSEAILRDLLIGQEWLRANGMEQEPRLAYFTDSFGCTPALPSLIRAAGFDWAAITRVDGMFFAGCDYESKKRFPRPDSSAALLLDRERTLDFVWRSPDGAEVLCHWNAFTYGQGDMLAHRGLSRVYLFPSAVPDRSEHNVARRIAQFDAQLSPYSRTPYLFCPIGFDFVAPIPDLLTLLDRYNRRHYSTTGVWALNAGLDDYLALVDTQRAALPVLDLDPNPYWTGFYTARPTLKKLCFEVVDDLLLAEKLALLPDNESAGGAKTAEEIGDAWWSAVVSNHHDFITGTSPDRVVEEEQQPSLERAAKSARAAIDRLASTVETPRRSAAAPRPDPPQWQRRGGVVEVHTPNYSMELSEEAGGGITRAWCPTSGRELLGGISNDLICYRDSGGLWRMGMEFRGGVFEEIARASERPARLQLHEHGGGLEILCETDFAGEALRRRMWIGGDSPAIHMRVEGRAAEKRTLSVRFDPLLAPDRLAMDQPGCVASRPIQKFFDPTFWPFQSFLHLHDEKRGPGFAFSTGMPGAACYRPQHGLEAVALRNATRERAFGFLPIPGMPAAGHERSDHAFDYAIRFTQAGDWRDNDIPLAADGMAASPWDTSDRAELRALAASVVTTDRPDVVVTAVKPASRGAGMIVRLTTLGASGSSVCVAARGRSIIAASLCDARERDIEELEILEGSARLTMPGGIASVRLLT